MKLPKIKPTHNPERLCENRIRIGTLHYGVGSEIQDDRESNIWRLLELMNGTRSINAIVGEMLKAAPELDTESIYQAIDMLITSGFVEDAGAPPPTDLTSVELERYSRNTNYFAWVDTQPRASQYEIQRRLKRARVTILGLGGTGSAVAMSLAAAGVGSLHCVDFDRVEISNLNRQLLYTEEDIGLPKVNRAVERLRRINSQITVTGEELQVQSSDHIVPLMEASDLFILCADKPEEQIQYWTNDAALHTHTPWLISFYAGLIFFTGIFLPFQTPCYQCFAHSEEQKRELRDGGKAEALLTTPAVNSVIAPTTGLAGHLAALEAIYFLADLEPQTLGRIFHQSLMIYDHSFYIKEPFWTQCPACGSDSPYRHNYV
jgi:molybdopterin/thiamine biosynthesis adenylyltransferase